MNKTPALMMGGDPTMIRAARLDPKFNAAYSRSEAAQSIEVPCQFCGRMVLLAPSGQRTALGEPEPLVPLDVSALAEGRIERAGPREINPGPNAVICMWCALSHDPAAIAALDEALALARKALGKA